MQYIPLKAGTLSDNTRGEYFSQMHSAILLPSTPFDNLLEQKKWRTSTGCTPSLYLDKYHREFNHQGYETVLDGAKNHPSQYTQALESLEKVLPPPQTIMACSLGKDSIAALILALQDGVRFDHVYFVDMRGAEFEETYAFIPKVEQTLGIKIEILESSYTFDELFYTKISKGSRAGKNRGWAAVINGCHFQRDMKIPAMKQMYKAGNADIYIGLSVEESDRLNRFIYKSDHKNRYHFPLAEHGYTGNMARQLCQEYDLLHPLYRFFRRLGCWQCNRQGVNELRNLYWRYPEKWIQLENYQRACSWDFQPGKSVFYFSERFAREGWNLSLEDILSETIPQRTA